jgi:rhodanese-related sulfurtransferase
MTVKEISPQQAYDILTNEPNAVYIDVRTPHEFEAGHPGGAVNIPVAFPNPAQGRVVANDDFVKVVESHFGKEKKIIVGCLAGPRSNAAARLLQAAGYQDVSNVIGGFGGMRDSMGRIIAPGWADLGLPVSQDNGEGVSYASLSAKTR